MERLELWLKRASQGSGWQKVISQSMKNWTDKESDGFQKFFARALSQEL